MHIALPEKVNYIIRQLEAAGHEAFAVGGCVRDSVLGRKPEDWDITTSACPKQVKELFRRTVDTGIEHGTVTVMLGDTGYEVTTYRIEGEYLDARHPKDVTFTADLTEDLKRRDFTINAMAYNHDVGLVDVFGGIEDIRNKVVRCVGLAQERFGEDALRILRAVRFSAQLGFGIEEKTYKAICEMAPSLEKISAERIQAELVKLLVSDHPEEMRTLYRCGITDVILPEFSEMMKTEQNTAHHLYTVGEHTIRSLGFIAPVKSLRLTMLFHDVGKPLTRVTDRRGIDHFHGHPAVGARMVKKILRRLKFDNETIKRVSGLVLTHDERPPLDETSIRKSMYRNGLWQYPVIFAVKRADILAQSSYYQKEKLACVDRHEKLYREICQKRPCLSLKELAVTGSDLIAEGIRQGREIGEILEQMLGDVLEQPELNEKTRLLERLRNKKYGRPEKN